MIANRRFVALSAVVFALMPSSCTGQATPEDEESAALDAFIAAINTGDAQKVASLRLSDSAEGSFGRARLRGGENTIWDMLADVRAYNAAAQLRADDVVILPAGQEEAIAYFDAAWPLDPDARTEYRAAMTVVLLRSSEGWGIAHDHASAFPGSSGVQPGDATSGLDHGPTVPVRELLPCTVTRIVDGDTLDCEPLGRVRLIGIDTPERAQEPFGSMATQALENLLRGAGEVFVEADVEDQDRYDRALRYVWADGRMLNWALVRSGFAVLLTYPPNVQYVDWFRAAQDAASDEGAGLWSVGGFGCEPREFRRGACR